MGRRNKFIEPEESYDKANWEKEQVDHFCALCIKFIEAGHLKDTHLSEDGWDLLMTEFPKVSGKRYSRKQLKNKWDSLKINWKLWKQLKGKDMGLGWDPIKKTINAPRSWWADRLEAIPKASKFRKNGIDPELEITLDRMFSKTVAVGEFAWPLSCCKLPSDDLDEGSPEPIGLKSDNDSTADGGASVSVEDNKVAMSDESYDKANWEKEKVDHFCALCIKFIEAGHLKGTHLSEDGWDLLLTEFPKVTGNRYSKKQLKNKWDSLKINWKLWKQLKGGDMGLRWDPIKKTIDAPRSWWAERLEAIPKASKFRKCGIDPELESTLNRMFSKTVATGEFVWPISCCKLPSKGLDERPSEPIGPESDRDSTADVGASVSVEDRKRKQIPQSQSHQHKKGRKVRSAHKITSCFERLVGAVESRSVDSDGSDSYVPSIANVIGQMDAISELDPTGELYMFGIELFRNKENREIFAALKANQVKLVWLKRQKEAHEKK